MTLNAPSTFQPSAATRSRFVGWLLPKHKHIALPACHSVGSFQDWNCVVCRSSWVACHLISASELRNRLNYMKRRCSMDNFVLNYLRRRGGNDLPKQKGMGRFEWFILEVVECSGGYAFGNGILIPERQGDWCRIQLGNVSIEINGVAAGLELA